MYGVYLDTFKRRIRQKSGVTFKKEEPCDLLELYKTLDKFRICCTYSVYRIYSLVHEQENGVVWKQSFAWKFGKESMQHRNH